MEMDDILPLIKNLLVLDSEGKRIAVKYYGDEWDTVAAQSTFEKAVYSKTNRSGPANAEADILLFDDVTVVYKAVGDLMFFVTGASDENEIILFTVLTTLAEALDNLLRGAVEKKTVLENLDLVLLSIDELVDDGIILETDAMTIALRVTMRSESGDIPLAEQTFSQALAHAKEQLARSLLK